MATHLPVKGTVPPLYSIDLDLPPRKRYVELARQYSDHLRSLTSLFDDLVKDLHPSASPKWFRRLARVSLRRLYSREETEEIRGISEAIDVEFFLVVALNVLLDLLMGCTSGAARCREIGETESKMLHFRSLDWGMDSLRRVIVQLNFKRSTSSEPDRVLATSITYVGFVGILTGVRSGLSLSLNFRPVHNATTTVGHFRYYSHVLLTLLGWRRSISSLLRELLLPALPAATPPSLADIMDEVPRRPSTAAYLIFSNGDTTITMEKDSRSALLRSSSSFIVITNHDIKETPSNRNNTTIARSSGTAITGMLQDFIEDSEERRDLMLENWQKRVRQMERERKGKANVPRALTTSRITRSVSKEFQALQSVSPDGDIPMAEGRPDSAQTSASLSSNSLICATQAEVVRWLCRWPTTNETTHFATVLDAKEGKVSWVRMYLEPLTEPS